MLKTAVIMTAVLVGISHFAESITDDKMFTSLVKADISTTYTKGEMMIIETLRMPAKEYHSCRYCPTTATYRIYTNTTQIPYTYVCLKDVHKTDHRVTTVEQTIYELEQIALDIKAVIMDMKLATKSTEVKKAQSEIESIIA